MDMNVWQVGGSGNSRSLASLFLKYHVAVIGPGDPGDFRTTTYDPTVVGKRDCGFVRQFACDVQPGDAILLRTGTRKVVAVGRIEIDQGNRLQNDSQYSPSYFYASGFGDVDGWDLQHAHRVTWKEIEYEFARPIVGVRPSRFSRVNDSEVIDWTKRNIPNEKITKFPTLLPPLVPLSDDEAADELFKSGLSLQSVDNTMAAIRRIRRLARWYSKEGWPLEHEVVAYMVLPLLLGLGWSEQQMAVEWNRIDVAVFKKNTVDPAKLRRPENCCMILEVKQVYQGLADALDQACNYNNTLKSSCQRRCIATDGVRYRLFKSDEENLDGQSELDEIQSAYMNLEKLTSTNVLQELMPSFALQ